MQLANKILDLITEIQLTGFYKDRKSYFLNILGSRINFTNTTGLNDLCEFLTTQSASFVESTNVLEVVSSSANDTINGIGSRRVKITYNDENGNLTESPAIDLNGLTPVPVGFRSTGILWMEVIDSGSNGVSSGNIVLRQVGGSAFEQITAGGNKSMSARFTVPNGYTGHLFDWTVESVVGNFDARIRTTVSTLNRTINSQFLFQDRIYLGQADSMTKQLNLIRCPQFSKIKISGIPSVNNSRAGTSFSLILIKN